ncbi:DUF3987 domain-containing protein [Bremerella cremea]|uniref:DUF3987 domain-containing protein n=1 Tax=Bremerella cremea TaxID=1031537 RepID=A0A368KW89_9BACT|nr:DUF3987 domain-containing protein [Bremerella cremea]RCS52629.1 DUF3987 domain-containing protein [Bremerella cremea]
MQMVAWGDAANTIDLSDELLGYPLVTPQWAPLVPLAEHHLPEFPTYALPETLRLFVEAAAAETQTPIDLAAMQSLGVCSAAIAQKVRIKARPGLVQPTNLFLASFTDGTLREEDLLARLRQPLIDLEADRVDAAHAEIAQAQTLRRQDMIRLRLNEKLGPDGTSYRDKAVQIAREIAENPLPVMPRLLVDDRTPQHIETLLAEQNGRLACFFGEGAVLDQFTGTTSQRQLARHQLFRQAYRGDTIQVDLPRGNRKVLRQASLTCAYAIRRDTIEALQQRRTRRGRGLLDCFLFSLPSSNLGRREIAAPAISTAASVHYKSRICYLDAIEGPLTLQLDEEARALFETWETEVEGMLSGDDSRETFRAWLDRLPANMLRVAGVLHCYAGCVVPDIPTQVSVDVIRSVIEIGRYLISHAEAVLGTMHCHDANPVDGARYLAQWIKQHRIRVFTRREAHQRSRARFTYVEQINAPLAELVRRGYLRVVEEPSDNKRPGRPLTPRYHVNPAVFAPPEEVPEETPDPSFEYETDSLPSDVSNTPTANPTAAQPAAQERNLASVTSDTNQPVGSQLKESNATQPSFEYETISHKPTASPLKPRAIPRRKPRKLPNKRRRRK